MKYSKEIQFQMFSVYARDVRTEDLRHFYGQESIIFLFFRFISSMFTPLNSAGTPSIFYRLAIRNQCIFHHSYFSAIGYTLIADSTAHQKIHFILIPIQDLPQQN